MKNKSKIALLFNSKNNYQLFEEIFFKYTTVDFSDYYIFNIDINSSDDQKQIAEKILKKYNIIDIKINNVSDKNYYCASRTMEICMDYINENNLDVQWLMWCSHDCYMLGSDFMTRLDSFIKHHPEFDEKVGAIGFCDYGTVTIGSPIYGRGMLLGGINEKEHGYWYENLPKEYSESDYFIVEVPQDNTAMFNIKLWRQAIEPDYTYILYNWMDDISHQFALKNIASVCIPSLEIEDLYREKVNYGVSRSIGDSKFHHDTYGRASTILSPHWEEKWLYPRPPAPFRESFAKAAHKYSGTIQEKLVSWHINDGPKKLEDLNEKNLL